MCPELIHLPPNWDGIPGPRIQTYRSASDKLLLATSMVSVIYWATPDGSCNKTYFHLLPGHVGGHTRRHRLIKEGGEPVSPKGGHGTLARCPHHPDPLILALTSKASVCQQNIFWGVVSVERKGVSFRVVVMVMRRVYTEQKPEDPQAPFPFSIAGSNTPPGQALNNIHGILCSIYKISSCSTVLAITSL